MNSDDPTFLGSAEFQQIAALGESEQRELLDSSDPRARVWAAWALGLRLSDGISPEIRETIGAEPVAGVRRHLLVMLAGFGEVDIVAALARHDPDEYVRKTAARFVGELSVKYPDAFVIASQMLHDADPAIRAAVVDGLPEEVPADIARLLRDAHDDESGLVREAMARRDAATSNIWTLRKTATRDANAVVRRSALKALVGHCGVAGTLEGMTDKQRGAAIADLKAVRVRTTFEDIAALEPGPAFLDLLDDGGLGVHGRVWLLGLPSHQVRDYWRRVGAAYTDVVVTDAHEQRAITAFIAKIEDTLRSDTRTYDEEGALMPWGDWEPWEKARRGLIEQLRCKLPRANG